VIRIAVTALALLALPAQAQQTRLYGPDGRSLGTAATAGSSTRYYDSAGRSAGTSTTIGDTTTFYDARGNAVARSAKDGKR
jgi:YD repeat-containing protein